jgi:exodeoxyribonuclease VII large subunit
LTDPDRLLGERRQLLDDARDRMAAAVRRQLTAERAVTTKLSRRLLARHPSAVAASARAALGPLEVKLAAAARRILGDLRSTLGAAGARLDALSPLSVLGRGYAIATGPSGRAILDAGEVRAGDTVDVRVHRGSFRARVLGKGEGGSGK